MSVRDHARWVALLCAATLFCLPSASSAQSGADTARSGRVIESPSTSSQFNDSSHSIDPRAVLPERPTVATHAYTIAPGYVEIETGVQGARPAGSSQLIAAIVVKLGLARRSQLELQGGYLRDRSSGRTLSGGSDLGVALKQRVLDGVPIIADFSVQGTVKLATGGADIGTGTTDLSLLLISSRPLGSGELDLNAGWTRRSGDGSMIPRDASLLTASLGMPLAGRLGAVAELFAYPGTGGASGARPSIGFLVGPTVQLHPWFVLDAGAILDVQAMGANAIYAGLTWNAGKL